MYKDKKAGIPKKDSSLTMIGLSNIFGAIIGVQPLC
jgi:hypothetical protein